MVDLEFSKVIPVALACVQIFDEAIKAGVHYKENSSDFLDQVMGLLGEVLTGRCV